MSGGLTMDHTLLARSIWTAESKFLQQPPVDLYTSVVVTRSIPAGTCFGPCVLQSTFYETIAFIAQKSCDKRAKSCVFRVDPDAMRNSALVLSWLRLVQAARNAEEQNTEAFLKEGQLYVRTTRDIRPEEELLVWYDQELSHLLGFTDITKGSKEEFRCGRCDQVFRHEYPFVAHRFLCAQAKSDTWGRELYEHKHVEIKRQHRVTDFHNIARDLEHKKSSMNEDAEISPRKRRYEEILHPKWRKTVLLEKTNISNDDNITQLNKGFDQGGGGASSPEDKQKPERVTTDFVGRKSDDLSEAGKTTGTFTHGREEDTERRQNTGEGPCVHSGSYSAFSLVLSNNQREQKSAFCKPSKRTSLLEPQAHVSSSPAAPSRRLEEMSDAFPPRTALGYNNLMASSILSTDLQSVHSQVALGNTFHYAPEQWSRNVGAQLQSTPSLTILPPTFTSFGVSVQNWCAKCNLSFRMTSDLVFHMRSHHKKEFAAESQVRRRREENLTCPICHEYFRERHHLSRHMTSHN